MYGFRRHGAPKRMQMSKTNPNSRKLGKIGDSSPPPRTIVFGQVRRLTRPAKRARDRPDNPPIVAAS
jgi:hypothetical protein